jgi:hypothetical protein
MNHGSDIHKGGAIGMLAFIVLWPILFFLIARHMGVTLSDTNGRQFLAEYGFAGVLKLYGVPTLACVFVSLALKTAIGSGTR